MWNILSCKEIFVILRHLVEVIEETWTLGNSLFLGSWDKDHHARKNKT